jgi:hypothetical protein
MSEVTPPTTILPLKTAEYVKLSSAFKPVVFAAQPAYIVIKNSDNKNIAILGLMVNLQVKDVLHRISTLQVIIYNIQADIGRAEDEENLRGDFDAAFSRSGDASGDVRLRVRGCGSLARLRTRRAFRLPVPRRNPYEWFKNFRQ